MATMRLKQMSPRPPRIFPRACLEVLLLLGLVGPAPGDTPQSAPAGPAELKKLSLEELSQIDVTSPSREPRQAFQTPVAIYVITSDDIRRSGATTIPEVLRLAPGVEVARIDGNRWSVGIRGFGSDLSRDVLVLMDGRTVYTTLLAGTYWQVQDTGMEDIDRIEIIRGPGGTIWGPNAVNGVINIITKSSKETQGLLASAGGGNVEQGFANLRYGGGNGKDFTYRVYGKTFTRSPEFHPDKRNFDDWRSVQGGFRMEWNERDRDSFTLQGDIYVQEAGESVQANTYEPPFQRNIDKDAQLSGGNVMGRWTRVLKPGNDIQVQLYYDRTNRHEANFGDLRDTFDVDFLQHVKWGARNQISWGLGARASRGNDLQVVSGLTFVPHERTDQLYTAFLQDEFALVENRLTLTAGVKMLRTNFTGFDFEPSARLMWTPNNTQAVWAAFTHALRTPSDAEEDFFLTGYLGNAPNGTPFFARINANDHFAPEQLNGTELGYRQLLGKKAYLDVATFYNHYHDLFGLEIAGATFLESNPAPPHLLLPAQFGNALLGTTKGFEISPEFRPASFWRLRASYSYLQTHIRVAPGVSGAGPAGISDSPKHQVTIQSAFDISKTLSLDLTYRYVSVLPIIHIPPYSTGDARLAWRVHRRMEVALVGENLFQPSHPEFAGDPGPLVGVKRSVYAKLTWSE
jgi:iron complex outermembrane recepter protein